MNEYEIFRLIWWALLGILLIGLAVMDGFDLGAAMLMPFIGKSDTERRVVINTVGPAAPLNPGAFEGKLVEIDED